MSAARSARSLGSPQSRSTRHKRARTPNACSRERAGRSLEGPRGCGPVPIAAPRSRRPYASSYRQLSGTLALVPLLAVHWALLVPLKVSVAVPPLNELVAVPDCGHLLLHVT